MPTTIGIRCIATWNAVRQQTGQFGASLYSVGGAGRVLGGRGAAGALPLPCAAAPCVTSAPNTIPEATSPSFK